ncbi:hypothetical protein PVAND_005787 [Polypedilum vanderplanki]|uniref:Uncharacterized protein n=1 Tax=Polypedilum vanderplanki TaxID=319348 RepID=A0A9J6C1N9_POLVA|nr:hypothetical protein PVAND_005787 [Polypedilum vanderplanki]
MRKLINCPIKLTHLCVALILFKFTNSQTTCNNGQGRIYYERLPNQQLQGFDDEVVRDTAPAFRTLEKCQDLCLRDRTASNNLVRACSSFDFQPGSRIAAYGGNIEYEESTCYLTREQASPEGIGNLMLVPNSIHFNEVCLTSNRPERECPSRRYVFERYPRKKLKLPVSDIKEITAANRTDCEDKCLSEFSFVCRSANYDSTLRSCSLSRFTRRTHPELLEDDPNSDYLENACLNSDRRCDGLIVFVKEANKKLGGPFEVDIFNNMTLEDCQQMCLRAEKYLCRSIEFDEESRQCILLEEDSVSQKDDITISSDYHHFYDLVCLDNQRGSEYPDNSVTSHLFDGISGRRPDTAFQRYRNSRLSGEFHSEITGRSLSECLDECLRQTSFQCRSAVYSDRFRTCRLSRYNQKDSKRIIYDADYDYYENLMLGTDKDMGNTRPDMDWPTTHPDDRYGGAGMPGRYPMYPTSPIPYDDRDRYGPMMPGMNYPSPYDDRDRDRYGPMRPGMNYPYDDRDRDRDRDRYGPMRPGMSYPYDDRDRDRDRYGPMRPPIGMSGAYPPVPPYDDRDRYPMRPSMGYPAPPPYDDRDRYGPMRPPIMSGSYPSTSPYDDRDRYGPMRPGMSYPPPPAKPVVSNEIGPTNTNRYPDTAKDRYNPDDRAPSLFPDNRQPPMRGQPIDPMYSRYPDPMSSAGRYPMMPPPSYLYGVSENRFPVGTDRFPTNIYKYGNRPGPMYPMSSMGYDMDNRGYGPPMRPMRPPYVMIGGYGDLDNMIGGGGGDIYGSSGRPIYAGTRCDDADSYRQMGLRQKMRNQFIRRKLKARDLIHCQRECSNAKDFVCRSFNYRDEGSERPPQPGVESFNCELSDRDTRELDLNNPQMFENGNYDFYERSIGARTNDGDCLDVSQVCNEDGMEFTLRTNEPFAGRIYAYGFYDRCFFRGNGGTVNVLRISGVGGYPECGTQRYGDTMTNIIVVQFSEHLQTGRDKRFNLTCLFRGPGESVVTSGYIGAGSGSPVPIEYLPAENSMSNKVRLMILYQGRPTTTIAIGDPLTFRLEAQDGYNHVGDIFATNVVARDPYSGRSVQLIDRYGCPVDTFVFPELGRSRDGDSLEARFNAFKIPESNFLVFEATVRTCRDGCQPAYCNNLNGRSEPSFGRRRRSINDTDIVVKQNDTEDEDDDNELTTIKNDTVIKVEEGTQKETSFPEQVREMIEVFETREEMQQETIAKKMISLENESVCLSTTEYYGLILSTMLLLILLFVIITMIGLFYKKYWKTIVKNGTFDYHSNNSFTSSLSNCEKSFGTLKKKSNNKDEFNEAYRSSSVSIFGSGLQKTFATGNLSRICQIPVMNPINKSNSSHFSDDSEPIYTDPSLFEKSRI